MGTTRVNTKFESIFGMDNRALFLCESSRANSLLSISDKNGKIEQHRKSPILGNSGNLGNPYPIGQRFLMVNSFRV